jgi:hypothetical protein
MDGPSRFMLGMGLTTPHLKSNRAWRRKRLSDVKDATLSRQSARRWRQDCQPYAPAALFSQKHYFSVSGINFFYRLSEPQGLVRPEGLGRLKTFIQLIGSGTRDLPACSIVINHCATVCASSGR